MFLRLGIFSWLGITFCFFTSYSPSSSSNPLKKNWTRSSFSNICSASSLLGMTGLYKIETLNEFGISGSSCVNIQVVTTRELTWLFFYLWMKVILNTWKWSIKSQNLLAYALNLHFLIPQMFLTWLTTSSKSPKIDKLLIFMFFTNSKPWMRA